MKKCLIRLVVLPNNIELDSIKYLKYIKMFQRKSKLSLLLIFMSFFCSCQSQNTEQLIPLQKENGQWGLFDENGKEITEKQYTLIHSNLKSEGIFGNGSSDIDNLLLIEKGDTVNFSNVERQYILRDKISSLGSNFKGNTDHFLFKKGDKYGIIDTNGNVLIKPKYETAPNHEKYGFIVYDRAKNTGRRLFGAYDLRGKPIVECKYSSLSLDSLGYRYMTSKGKFGLSTYEGEVLMDSIYDDIQTLKNGLYYKKLNRKYTFTDIFNHFDEEKTYLMIKYLGGASKLLFLHDGNEKGFGVYNFNNQQLVKERFYNPHYFNFNNQELLGIDMVAGSDHPKKGQIRNLQMDVIYERDEFFRIRRLNDKFITLEISGKSAMFDLGFNQLTAFDYESIDLDMTYQNSRFLRACRQYTNTSRMGQCGVIDTMGHIVIPCEYDRIEITLPSSLLNDTIVEATVRKNHASDVKVKVDPNIFSKDEITTKMYHNQGYWVGNRMVLPTYFDDVHPFKELILARQKSDDFHFIYSLYSKEGEVIVSSDSNYTIIDRTTWRVRKQKDGFLVDMFDEEYLIVAKKANQKTLYGVIDKDGTIIIPIQYDLVRRVDATTISASRGDQQFLFDLEGNKK